MSRLRKTPNAEDLLLYNDEDYLIFRKYGAVAGSIDSPFDIARIGIGGLARVRPLFAVDDNRWRELLNDLSDDIVALRENADAMLEDGGNRGGIPLEPSFGYKIARESDEPGEETNEQRAKRSGSRTS